VYNRHISNEEPDRTLFSMISERPLEEHTIVSPDQGDFVHNEISSEQQNLHSDMNVDTQEIVDSDIDAEGDTDYDIGG
jgi:hypothetical protein